MTLYEIRAELEALVNEDGEITDMEAWENLQMAECDKIENVALWIKNLLAEIKAIREEEKALAERRKKLEKKVEHLEGYLDTALDGKKFETARVSLKFRISKSLEVIDEQGLIEWAQQFAPTAVRVTYAIDKMFIRDALKNDVDCPYAKMRERRSLQVA